MKYHFEMERHESKKMPMSQKCLYLVAAVGIPFSLFISHYY